MTNRINDVRVSRGPLAQIVRHNNGEARLVMVEEFTNWSLTPIFKFAFHILEGMIGGEKRPLRRQLEDINIEKINTLLKYKGLVDLLFSLFDGGGGAPWKYQRMMLCAYAEWLHTGKAASADGYWCEDTLRWMADNLGNFEIFIITPFQKLGEEIMEIAECHDGVLILREESLYEG